MSSMMNNGNLWLMLLLLVVVSFMFVVQHSTTPSSPSSSLAGARLRAREQSINGHGHTHGDDWTTTIDAQRDTLPVVTSPYATLWHDEDKEVGAQDGYQPPVVGTVAARLAKRRRVYYEQHTTLVDNSEPSTPTDDQPSRTVTPRKPPRQPPAADVVMDEPSVADEPTSDIIAAMPPLSTFQLDTRIWPLPSKVTWPASGSGVVALLDAHVRLITNVDDATIDALWPLIFTSSASSPACQLRPSIVSLTANADNAPTNDRADHPHGDNEGYELTVTQSAVTLRAAHQWGIINGLKTLAQLIQWRDQCAFIPNVPVTVEDTARFPIRGFLIDSPRHWINLQQVRAVVDRIAVMKLNVLHFRLTDDQSFLIESKRYPGLNQGQAHTYKQTEITELIAYARARGVRIIPEIGVPGHALAWGKGAHPELTAKCPAVGWSIPLDPTIEFTWTVLREFYEEMLLLFHDPFIHLGGDEIAIACYDQDRALMDRARAKGLNSGAQVLESFTTRWQNMLTTHAPFAERSIILWEDLYENHKTMMHLFRKDIVFHTWLSTKNGEEVADHGFRSIRSTYLYFNEIHDPSRHYEFYSAFKEMYQTNWHMLNFFQKKWPWKDSTKHLFTGGIACIWENPYSTYSVKVWPLLPAAAERLWSAPSDSYDMDAVHKRLKVFQSYIESLQLDVRHATSGGDPQIVADYDSIRRAAGAKLGARDSLE